MDINESKRIIQAGLAWANWTEEQQEAMRKALQSMGRYEKNLNEAKKLYADRITLEDFGGRVTNIIIDDIN
ncbi:hypothetical protein B1B04_08390 [Lysinibacillus sp. KCTC 33748]|nr:hypothetical protein B1B04_08390 [Lysinibacillus sp. KCTC 33748]SKB59504.1 hypothetical protein SAMN06295926_104159 [Lysinibacillus sp. AC-3]